MNVLQFPRSALLCATLLVACSDPDPFSDATAFVGPVATASSLVWIDEAHRELRFLTPTDQGPTWTRSERSADGMAPTWIASTVDGSQVLAMIAPLAESQHDSAPHLIAHSSQGDAPPQRVDLPVVYPSLSQSADGRWAVLHFSPDSPTASGVIQNANLVTIVDMATLTARTFTLNGFGGRLVKIEFPAPSDPQAASTVRVGDRDRALIAFISNGELVLVDALDPLAAEHQVAVRFFPEITFTPEETLLRPGNDAYPGPALFLRSSQASDVAMLSLVDASDAATGQAGFTVQVSLIPVGRSATDFALLDENEVPYLVTLDPYRSAAVFTDIRTQQGFVISLREAAERFMFRQASSPAGVTTQMVAWAQADGAVLAGGRMLHTLDLEDIDKTAGQNPRSIYIQNPILDVVSLDNDRALVGTQEALYVVDFARDQVTPLSTPSTFDPASAVIFGDTLLLGPRHELHLSAVDLLALSPASVRLDAPIDGFFYLPLAEKVVVLHPDPAGHLTTIDPRNPSRETSVSQWGFFYEGFLDQEQQ